MAEFTAKRMKKTAAFGIHCLLSCRWLPKVCLVLFAFPCGFGLAQSPLTGPSPAYASPSRQSEGPANAVALGQSSFSGSVPEGKATAEVIQLSFADAIQRGDRKSVVWGKRVDRGGER